VVGLGNPGEKYARTRHNVGFLVVDALSKRLEASFVEKPRLKSFIAEASTEDGKRLLVKPTTFMNRSGEAIMALTAWQKPDRLIVIHDDVDLPFGRPNNTRIPLEDWVLGTWNKEEMERLPEIVDRAIEIIGPIIEAPAE